MSRIRPSSILALVALATLLPRPVGAQEASDTFPLRELVVTATRVPTPRAAVPAAVTVLDGEALRARGTRFVAEALREVPGASLARTGSHGGLTSLFLRGGESDYVQVMIDGVVLNDPGGAIDLGQLTTDQVERIEIVRGPVSVLYGSDAVTGVVHIITRRGAGAPRLTVGAEMGRAGRVNGDARLCPGYPRTPCPEGADLGSYTTRAWDAGLAGGLGPVGFSLGASGFDTDGGYAFNNGYENRTVSGNLRSGDERAGIALTARWTDGVHHYPTDGAGRLEDANASRASESLAVGIEAGRFFGAAVETRLSLSFHDGDYRTIDEPDGPADTLGFFASRALSRVDRRKADLHANVRVGPDATATVGMEVERQEGESAFTSRSQFGPFESETENDRSNRAAYAQIQAAPLGTLSLTGGARVEDNDRFGTFLTWRAGANLRIAEATTVRASAGTAFKEPTFFENYAEGFTRGNPALEPEASRSWEVGVERRLLEGRARVGATWFDQRFRDLIQYVGAPAAGEPNYVNVGEAASRGLEVEARLGRPAGPFVAGSWVRLDTEVLDAGAGADPMFREGRRLLRRPRDRFDLSVGAPLGDAQVGASLAHVGSRDDLDFLADPAGARVTLDPYTVVDLTVAYRLVGVGRDLTLQLRVENALDADHEEVANFPGPARGLFVGLRAGTGF